MSSLINFESSYNKAAKREDIRKQRENIIQRAKAEYERNERRKTEAKLRGEDTWMLQSVSERIDNEQQDMEQSKSKKKKKKKKKDKKKKKKRKKESSSSSDSDSESEPQWMEKVAPVQAEPKTIGVVKGPKMEREGWMLADFASIGGVSRAELRAKKLAEEEERKQQQNMLDRPGQHERELNPYWKAGGSGLPEEKSAAEAEKLSQSPVTLSGDGGVEWLRRALRRCEQLAEEENKSVEEVAAERYGSLKELKAKLKNAEEQLGKQREKIRFGKNNTDYRRRDDKDSSAKHIGISESKRKKEKQNREISSSSSDSSDGCDDRYKHKSHSSGDRRHRHRSQSRDREYKSSQRWRSKEKEQNARYQRDSRSRSRERNSGSRYRNRSRERDYYNTKDRSRSRSGERDYYKTKHRSRSRSRDRMDKFPAGRDKYNSSGTGSGRLKALSSRFKKPGNDSDNEGKFSYSRSEKRTTNSQPTWKKKRFMKPGDSENSNASSGIAENKRSFVKPGELASQREKSNSPEMSKSSARNYDTEIGKSSRRKSPSESSASESSSDSESSSHSENEKPGTTSTVASSVKPLTEQEINQLGAKMVKAEIMGNTALAEKLKLQIEQARKTAANPIATTSKSQETQDEDNVVVLTRMNRQGMVRPLAEREHPKEPKKGRRKKQKIETHAGDKGERARYFHDDDKFDLKQMVEQEKLGTAEDSNMMFARLAGRSMDKTTDDYQLDDVLIDRASKKMSDSRAEEKEHSMAIFEHRKISEAMEKCSFCFNKVPKHLIIAIGIKCYLSLPNHKSLSEGHCLIVPMQHVSQGTVLDEDVWDEMQVFRKGLTKLFEERDEDCVFMEMSRGLRHHPHMMLECVPMPREVGDLAPIYFKKAIQECESEWSDNKKVVDLSGRDVRRAIPKGFPYFSVDFGMQGGFAHVIEDEKEFPHYFGREVVGGMLDAGPELWRKPHKENFEEQRKKVLKFAEWWKPYDWTSKLKAKTDDDI